MHEKAKFKQGYGRPVKISTSCVDESCVMQESRRPMERTLDAWIPRRSGVVVKNKFRELQMGAVDDDEEEDIAAVNYEANDGSCVRRWTAELRGACGRGGREC